MSRAGAIARAYAGFDDGRFLADLRRRVAIASTSQEAARAGALRAYLDDEIAPALNPLRKQIAELEKSRPKIPTLPVMRELPADKRRVTRLLVKGNFLVPGEVVEAATPAALRRHCMAPRAKAS